MAAVALGKKYSFSLPQPPPPYLLQCILPPSHHSLWLNFFLLESFSYNIFIIYPRLKPFNKKHCNYIRVENADWVCSYSSRNLRKPIVNMVPLCILSFSSAILSISWFWCASCSQCDCHSSSHHMETWSHPVKGIFYHVVYFREDFLACVWVLREGKLGLWYLQPLY